MPETAAAILSRKAMRSQLFAGEPGESKHPDAA